MDRFGAYVAVKREIASALAPAYASGVVSVSHARAVEEAIQEILVAGVAGGSLRTEVRAEDLVAAERNPRRNPRDS